MRKILGTILVIMILVSNINITAQEGLSSWAEPEGKEAIKEGIVPDSLNSNYQNNIKRYEYVLLALEILELNNSAIKEEIKYPFSDISGHTYEDEIVLAYNAGLIIGDGEGHFFPDKLITRQEITSLICNLILALDKDADILNTTKRTYADGENISSWAKTYMNYCYNQNIMKGTGKINGLDRMDPKGHATREQAIILLLRFAKSKDLLTVYDLGDIEIVTYDEFGNKIIETSTLINEFASNTSKECANLLIDYSTNSNYEVKLLSDKSFELQHRIYGKVTFIQTNLFTEIELVTNNLETTVVTDMYLAFSKLYTNSEQVENDIIRGIQNFSSNKDYYFGQEFIKGTTMIIEYNKASDTYQYKLLMDNRL